MIGYQEIEALANRASELKEYIASEEGSKTSLVLPMLSALGYDIFNPKQIMAELTADVGIKRGEKVDYAIMASGKPKLIIECKKVGSSLGPEAHSQLFRYFTSLRVRFGVLTDGIVYRFYTDLDATNIMDSSPFFEFNLLAHTQADIDFLSKFRKGCLVGENKGLLKECRKLKLSASIRDAIRYTISPSEGFIDQIKSSIAKTSLSSVTRKELEQTARDIALEEALATVERSLEIPRLHDTLRSVVSVILGKDIESSIIYRTTANSIYAESKSGHCLFRVFKTGLDLRLQISDSQTTYPLRVARDITRYDAELRTTCTLEAVRG